MPVLSRRPIYRCLILLCAVLGAAGGAAAPAWAGAAPVPAFAPVAGAAPLALDGAPAATATAAATTAAPAAAAAAAASPFALPAPAAGAGAVMGTSTSTGTGAPRTLRFEQLNVEQGLAQESVLAMVQDRQGFMWFGSQAGLSRYDGYRTLTFKSVVGDPSSLAANWVRVLHLDEDGTLWVGTDSGLDRYDARSQSFTRFAPSEDAGRGNGNSRIRAIVGDGARGLWIGTSDGLQHFDPASGQFTIWHHRRGVAESLADNEVNALARDAGGRLWIGTSKGVDLLLPGASGFRHIQPDTSESSKFNNVRTLLADADHTLWVGSDGGVERWSGLGGAPRRERLGAAQGLASGAVLVIYQDPENTVWVGSQADGLYRWLPGGARFARYRHLANDGHSVADNQISSLYRDRVGTFWVGTWYNGASRVDLASGGFSRYVKLADEPNTLSDNKVRAIVDAGGGRLWLGTNGGLNLFDLATSQAQAWRPDAGRRRHDPGGDDQVTALWPGRDGTLWVGSNYGLNQFDPATQRFTHLSFSRGDAARDIVRGIYGDRAGTLWIASRGGIHHLDPARHTFQTYRHDPADSSSLADNVVRPMLEDRAGRFWIGGFNGLDLMDRKTGRFRHFRHNPRDPTSISHDEVHYLYEDARGVLWVGTANGLNRMQVAADGSATFRRYQRQDGMADDAIAGILSDQNGDLWLSTNSGLSRLDIKTGLFRNYAGADGTIEGAYFDGSAARAADGTLYFGGFNGLTSFVPAAVRDNTIPPPVAITELQIFNKPVRAGQGDFPAVLKGPIERTAAITLTDQAAVFSLEFAALHYAAPQRNRFAYQLQGFDQDWVFTDASKRFATYTNLDPGEYVFRVTAANKDGHWNPQGAALRITILPPYWKTWWFRALVAALLLGAAYAAYRVRLRVLGLQKNRLELQVGLRTAEVQHKNQLLHQQKEELEQRRLEAESQRAEAEQRRIDAERQKLEVERQKENVEQAHRNISVLSEIGREMTATLDIETAMAILYRHVHQLMDAGIFGIGFYREEKGVIEFPFSIEQGLRSEVYTRSVDDPNQFAVWCLTHNRAVFINDIHAEYAQYIGSAGMDTLSLAPMVDGSPGAMPLSMLYTPLLVNERVVGVLCVQSVEKHAYRRVHLDMLQTLAAHAAVGLDNARTYQQLEAALQALRETQAQLLAQEKQVRLHTEELALANRALQENDERLRLAKQKAEDATEQKSQFLANMSHEMRTPLAGVIGMLGFALRDRQLQEGTREQIMRGQANAQSLLSIINDLLDFSKIEAGKLSIENIDFSLGAAVDNVASLFEEQAAARSVDFAIDYAEDLPPFVVGDPTRLRQVLVNLVGNAFKFTERGGVTLRVERLAADTALAAVALPGRGAAGGVNLIRFIVEDSGIGIPDDAMQRLFQKFEQADASTTRRYGGTGLGLAICRQLVELMGGSISASSRLGQGSTFTFVLPLPDGIAPPLAPQVARAPHSHRLRVLCAEDFPTNQIIIRMMLEELGHDVDIAANGALAVAACARTRYDLILMDGRMPEMDGASATRLIRAGGPAGAPVLDQHMLIVALTANASEEDRSRYLAAGMDDFLTKPIDEASLHYQLGRAIAHQLQRGLPLPAMGTRPAARQDDEQATLALDAMFGVSSAAAPALTAAAAMSAAAPVLAAALTPAPAPGGALKQRIRSAFAGDVAGRLAELDQALAARDSDGAGRLLHGIKGSAGYLDEMALHQLCGELEQAADRQEWLRLERDLPDLRAMLQRIVAGSGT